MKILYIFFLLCIVTAVYGQRRTSSKEDTEDIPRPVTRGRGRARFTPEVVDETKVPTETTNNRRNIPRRRQDLAATIERKAVESPSRRKSYEVVETSEDIPIDTIRTPGRPRVITETHFEAKNASPATKLFDPSSPAAFSSTTTSRNIQSEETVLDNTENENISPSALEDSSEAVLSSSTSAVKETADDITKVETTETVATATSSNKPEDVKRKNGVRTRGNIPQKTPEVSTETTRFRTRTRATRKPEESVSSTPNQASRIVQRRVRTRPEASSAKTPVETGRRGPSVFVAEESKAVPSRTRSGRRLPTPSTNKPEAIEVTSQKFNSRRTGSRTTDQTTTTVSSIPSRGGGSRRNPAVRSRNSPQPTIKSRDASTTTISSRNNPIRSRSRFSDFPPIIDEQKLEVLPLFENEPKIVKTSSNSLGSSKLKFNSNLADDSVGMSATENNVKVIVNPTRSNNVNDFKQNLTATSVSVSQRESIGRAKVVKPGFKRKPYSRPTSQVKESVVAEVNEVTSKRSVITRKRVPVGRTTTTSTTTESSPPSSTLVSRVVSEKQEKVVKKVIVTSRGRKKSEVQFKPKKSLSSSEEDIDESDNYPEPFKALIQAKKQQTDDIDNELVPKITTPNPIIRTTRKRSSIPSRSTTERTSRPTYPSRRNKVVRSTISPHTNDVELPKREHRFHAKFSSSTADAPRESSTANSVDLGGSKSFVPKPPRGVYSSRKNKEIEFTQSHRNSFDAAGLSSKSAVPPKKSNRYSSKYRTEITARGASFIRSTTSAPVYIPTIPTAAYIPTVPTVTRPSVEYVWSERRKVDRTRSKSHIH